MDKEILLKHGKNVALVLDWVKSNAVDGHILVRSYDAAKEIGINVNAFSSATTILSALGILKKKSSGNKGTEIFLEENYQ